VLSGHIGKIMSALGAVISVAAIALEDNAAQINDYARQYLTERWLHRVGVALFVLLFARTWYTGWVLKKKQ
jgi:hypothetical protein